MWIYGTIVFLCILTVHMEEECEPGKYGNGCSQNCSQNCESLQNNIVLCDKDTGECYGGCKMGFYRDQCDQTCSRNCKDHTCIQQTGHCTRGCIDNHLGDFCETSQEITIVHQGTTYSSAGTTYSSHTTVTTGVVPTSSSQVIIPVVVVVLVLILVLVVAVIILIWCRKKKESQRDPDVEVGFLPGSPPDGQDKKYVHLKELDWIKDIQEMKEMMMSMHKIRSGAPQPSDSSGISPVSETQIECGRRETLRGSSQDDSATSGEGDTPMSGTPSRPDTRATPTPARRDARTGQDLHSACSEGKLAEVKRILDTGRADVNCRSVGRMTPVMWAARWGHRDVVELLVSRDADVSLVDDDGNNTLHWACEGGDRKTVEFVLSLDGVDINSRGWKSITPVMEAAWWGHRDVLEILVIRGADVSLVDYVGNNILHWACMGGDRKTVEFVLSLDGVDINSRGWKSITPVLWAARWGHRDVVKFLVSRGADVSLVTNGGNNILHWACEGGDSKTVEFVLSQDRVDINVRNNDGKTAADMARDRRHHHLSDLLVSRGTQ